MSKNWQIPYKLDVKQREIIALMIQAAGYKLCNHLDIGYQRRTYLIFEIHTGLYSLFNLFTTYPNFTYEEVVEKLTNIIQSKKYGSD